MSGSTGKQRPVESFESFLADTNGFVPREWADDARNQGKNGDTLLQYYMDRNGLYGEPTVTDDAYEFFVANGKGNPNGGEIINIKKNFFWLVVCIF